MKEFLLRIGVHLRTKSTRSEVQERILEEIGRLKAEADDLNNAVREQKETRGQWLTLSEKTGNA